MSPKTIDEAIEKLQKLEKTIYGLNYIVFNLRMESCYQFLMQEVQKFVRAATKANIDTNYNYSIRISNVKHLEFTIYDTDCLTILYAGYVDSEEGLGMMLALHRQDYQRRGEYIQYSCVLLIKSFKALQDYQTALKKHLKADAKLQKKPVSPLHSDADDSPW